MSLYALPRNLVLAASAGTGKTHALVGVVVHLLLGAREAGGAVDPGRIVATTFSRKAAAEIRARVSVEVERLAADPAASVYAEGIRTYVTRDAEIAKRARKALARLPQARFGTLHSFATGIVQRYAVELGLGPGFELATEADARARAEDALARAMERRLATSPDELRALAEAAGGVDRAIASFRRVLGQLEEDGRSARDLTVDDRDVVAIETQMRELLDHARVLSNQPKAEAMARALGAAWDSGDGARIEEAAAALTALPASGKKTPELESFFAFRAELGGTTNAERGRRLARTWRARHLFGAAATFVRDVVAEAESEIEETGRARAMLGFGEVLRAARALLRDRPDVRSEIGAGIEALLVDEFQDTSRVQRDLLQLLWTTDEAASGVIPPIARMRGTGLLVVGDRKQSIYGFRGADVGVFAELAVGLAGEPAREALGIPPGVTWQPKEPLADFHALRHNRRSGPSILAFANAFSARRFQVGEPPPELFEIAYVPATEDLLVPPEKDAELGRPRTTWLRVAAKSGSSTRLEEALVIAATVTRLAAAGTKYRDMAVLATTNGMLDAVAFALAQASQPYVVAGKSFFRAREISDLAAMLSLALDPRDRLALLEVLRGPWAGVHDETLLGLVEEGRGLGLEERDASLVRAEDRAAVTAIAELVRSLHRCAGRLGAGAILREAIAATGFEDVLLAMPRGVQRVANVQKLLAIADRQPDARAFARWLGDAKEQELAESEAATFSDQDDAVRLLTVHASKGLDFPVVFVPEIGAGAPRTERGVARVTLGAGDAANILSVRVSDDDGLVLEPPAYARGHATARRRDRAERQRLAYVAMTRAADAMYLVGGRTTDRALDPGASTLAVVEQIAAELPSILAVEEAPVPTMERRAPAEIASAVVAAMSERRVPAWKVLPIAPTALADFDHCARRFELVHLLGLPEHVRRKTARSAAAEASSQARRGAMDAQTQGTIAHAILEQLPAMAFLGLRDDGEERLSVAVEEEVAALAEREVAALAEREVVALAEEETLRKEARTGVPAREEEVAGLVARALDAAGVPADRPEHAAIAARVMRFLGSAYVARLGPEGARIDREVAFVLAVEDAEGRAVTLRGSMDLVVTWPDGSVDVVDYKSARGNETDSYAFQLDVYALAAQAEHPTSPRVRAGLSFLGAGTGDPVWRPSAPAVDVRMRIASLGAALVTARWNDAFPRVPIDRCEQIFCGFIGRCHPDRA